MRVVTSIVSGQWQGEFKYGPEYAPGMEPVSFRLVLKDIGEGRFEGKCIELDGASANPEIGEVKGYMEKSFISFTKEYSSYFKLDEFGVDVKIENNPKPIITYMGNYDWMSGHFTGQWEILIDDQSNKDGNFLNTGSGSWSMWKVR